jgi:hypothetical protein
MPQSEQGGGNTSLLTSRLGLRISPAPKAGGKTTIQTDAAGPNEATPMDELKPRYSWRKTWPDKEDHFIAFDGDTKFALMHIHHMGVWMWNIYLPPFLTDLTNVAPLRGNEPTARQAACAAEACYEEVLAGTWLGMVAKDIEAARLWREGRPGTQE